MHLLELARRFRDTGAPMMKKLKEVRAGEFRHPTRPTFARTPLRVLLIRVTAGTCLQMLGYLCGAEQNSSARHWIQAPSGEIDLRTQWIRRAKQKKRRFGYSDLRGGASGVSCFGLGQPVVGVDFTRASRRRYGASSES